MRGRVVVIVVGLWVGGCTAPDDIGGAGMVRRSTPGGEAAIQLVLEDRSIPRDEKLRFSLVNRGEVEVLTGLSYSVERRADGTWQGVTCGAEAGCAFPAVAIQLRPGGSTDPQEWPFDGTAEPGRYRISKSASYEGAADGGIELVAQVEFTVQ